MNASDYKPVASDYNPVADSMDTWYPKDLDGVNLMKREKHAAQQIAATTWHNKQATADFRHRRDTK